MNSCAKMRTPMPKIKDTIRNIKPKMRKIFNLRGAGVLAPYSCGRNETNAARPPIKLVLSVINR